jgi:hypothetical protein
MFGYVIALDVLIVALLGTLAVIVDLSAQAAAWRRIADERRWNHDRLKGGDR